IWERWDGWTEDKGFQTPAMNSFNHYSLGSVGEWIFRSVAGIGQSSESTGFEQIRIEPRIDPSLTFAEATYDSIRGRIATRWDHDGDQIRLRVEIPANCTAEVVLGSTVHTVASGTHELSSAM
ncbi:MAG: alpha-L-rhamnosidase C-terminal domain-containing protein, partial [Thermomicrobiales bacterium]